MRTLKLRIPTSVAIALSVFAGALIAVQSQVNGELAIALNDGLFAALLSFGHDGFDFEYVGNLELAKNFGSYPIYILQRTGYHYDE